MNTNTNNKNYQPRKIKKRFFTRARKKMASLSIALVLVLSMPFAYATEGGEALQEIVGQVETEVVSTPTEETKAIAPEENVENLSEVEKEESTELVKEAHAYEVKTPESTDKKEESQTDSQDLDKSATNTNNNSSTPSDTGEGTVSEGTEAEQTKPLKVELYGDGFDSGEAVVLELQKKSEAGTFAMVKDVEIKIGENQNNKLQDLEAGEYRFVINSDKNALAENITLTINGVESTVKTENGFTYDPAKETAVKITINKVEKKQDEPAPAPVVKSKLTFNVDGDATVKLVHKDGATVTIGNGGSYTFEGETYENVQIYGTTKIAKNISIEVVDAKLGTATGGEDIYTNVTEFFREVSFSGSDRIVNIEVSEKAQIKQTIKSVSRSIMPLANSGTTSQPEKGDVFTGKATVTKVEVLSAGGMVGDITIKFTSGILNGEAKATVYCDDHGRARPVATSGNVWKYEFTVTSVNKTTGVVKGNLFLEGTGEYKYADGYQRLAGTYQIKRSYGGYIKIDKDSSNTAITDGNPMYSLADAQYGIYSDSACTKLVDTLVTNASGIDTSKYLNAGTYYVKEIAEPQGYEIDTKKYTVKVSGGTVSVNGGKVYDEPGNDPAAMWAGKIDAETTNNLPQGSASLAGAEFTIKYYASLDFATAEEALASGNPTKTWVVATNENGFAALSENYLISGDDFYKTDNGVVTIPLGTIVIQETKAPEGYLLNEQIFMQKVTEEGLAGDAAITYNAPVVEEQVMRGGISISKTLEGGANEELEGIAFFIYNSDGEKMTFENAAGEMVDKLVLDANGKASTSEDALVYDTYTIVEDESSVPDDIIWYGDAQGEGSATVDEVDVFEHHVIYPVEVVNYKMPDFDLIKVDGDALNGTNNEDTADKVAGAEWKLEFNNDGSWETVGTYTTNDQGRIDFPADAIDAWGTYRLTETKPAGVDSNDGYMYPVDAQDPEYVEFVIDASTWDKFEAGTYTGVAGDSWEYKMVDGKPALIHTTENYKYRDIEVIKTDEDTNEPVANTKFSLWKYIGNGVPSEIDNPTRSDSHALYTEDPTEDIDTALWQKVDEGVTDDNGTMLFRGLTFGYYMTAEETPNPDYSYWWESDKSTWDKYYFTVDEKEQKQVQVYKNQKITLETTIDKNTITKTSAAFVSLPGQVVNFNNVGVEEYRYDISFTNGETNVRADQYTVIDNCEFVDLGIRLNRLWTPLVANDTNGTYNLWYQTNMTDAETAYDTASATANNPENELSDGTDRISTVGWKLWQANLSTDTRTQLSVADIGLAEGEYITGLMLEFGSVEVDFATTEPLSYMVLASEELNQDEIIPNSATSHITRNWNGGVEGDGLYDDAEDLVETRVLDTFSFAPGVSTWTGDDSGSHNGYNRSGVITGDFPLWIVAALVGVVAIAGGALYYGYRRMRLENGNEDTN